MLEEVQLNIGNSELLITLKYIITIMKKVLVGDGMFETDLEFVEILYHRTLIYDLFQ